MLSVIVITKNEQDRIERCLKSVEQIADEIIVLDSGSTDDTVDIVRKFTEKVYVTDWPGYGPQKQRALEIAKGEWVLSLDADEALTPELADEIKNVLFDVKPDIVAYSMSRKMVVFGERLDYGRSTNFIERLFRREGARFSDDLVHEKVLLPQGKTAKLKADFLHYSVRDFQHLLDKTTLYACLGADKKYKKGRHGGGIFIAALRAIWAFCHVYLLRLGFLDGGRGFFLAVIHMQYTFNKYAGLWAKHIENN